ncbi:MAG: alpha-2-macroglobulin family protein [Colwellia sp.]|uniref:alpha-2-macroglobulin family protein n=1 Tax=Colwellia sp. TaxID=56799 RepID=UPI001D9548C9|nr:alpha-2-macroglobulin [Colwellia sp.]NQY48947.1 alpha-2-macroglobulin family protein [Colwellia sp.]
MVKGLTTLKVILPLLLLLSACSEKPASTDTQTENNTQKSAIKPVEKPSIAVIQGNKKTIKEKSQPDYSDRKIEVLDIAERSFDGGNAIAVTLSAPLNPELKHDDYFSLTEKSGAKVDDSIVLSKNNKVVYFPFIEPSSTYKLTVYKGLSANNGSTLKKDTFKAITTRPIIPSYNFASKGSFLPLKQHKGLPIELVNIKEVNVDYFKVPDDQVVQFLTNKSSFQNKVYRYYAQQSISRAEQVYSARYQFKGQKNKRRTFNLPIQNIEALSSAGIYLAVMTEPNDVYNDISMTHFMVTDIGMHVRVYKNQLEVALNSLTNQKPLSAVKVTLLNNSGKQIDQFKSSPDGLGTLRTKTDARYIVAQSGASFSVVSLTGPALDLSEFTLAQRPFVADEIFVYSARDLYRPGESVDFNALLRGQDGQRIKAIALKANIKDPSGQTAKDFTWRSNSDGYFHQQFTIPKDAKTGTWLLEIRKHKHILASYKFKVEEFLPERLKLTFNQGETAKLYQLNDKLTVNVLGEYLYGAPASGNRFESRIVITPQRQPFDALKGFQFGNIIEKNLSQQYKLADVKLDSQGKTAITIENRWAKVKSPVQVTLQASLFETGGRAISRRHQTTVISGNMLIGIKPHFKNNPEHNSRVTFDVVTTNAQGKLTKNAALDVKLVREDRRYFWEFNNSDGWHYRWSDSEFVEYNSAVDTNANKASQLDVPVEYGRYRLEISDAATKTMTSVRFFAGHDWYSSWRNNQSSSQAARPDKVSLAWDKASYNAGDVAQLSIVPPKAGEALLLIESDKLLYSQRISIPAEGLNVAINIDEKWQRHDIYASIVHLQYGDNKKRITPTRAIGLIHLPLNRESRKLELEIESAKEIYPNQSYQVKVKVNGHADQQAKLTLAMVDVGVLSLTDFDTPDVHQFFFEPRRFQVDSRDLYQNLIDLNDAPLAKQKFGGDAELSRGGKKAQAEVQILSLFSGLVAVDNKGYATVAFDIPDFNGRVRLMAIAFTDDKFGSAESEMTIAAPIVSQIAMPRFLATGDHSTFALDLHNSTEQTQTLTVALTTTGPVSLTSADSKSNSKSDATANNSQEIILAAKEKTTLIYPVSVGSQEGRSKVSLSVQGVEGYPIDRNWHIAVRSAYPALIEYKNATLIKDQSFSFSPSDYAHLKANTLEAVLSVNNMVEFNSREQMKHLLKYPYGCLEQSTSSTYPWLYANKEILDSLDLKNTSNKHRLESINYGLSRIQAKALKNGSYGLWSNTSQEEHWLTAYVGDFLTDAKEQGIEVNRQQYQKTMARLTTYLKNQNGTYTNRWSESVKHYDFAYRAYAGYVLSRHNKASLSKLRDLAKHKSKDAESQLALIHLALALKNQGDDVNSQAMFDKAVVLERGTKYLSDYGSVIRDKALIIHLLIKHEYQLDYAFDTALALSKILADKKYLSTQERNALFLASISLEQGEQKDWQALLSFNQAKSTIQKSGAYTQKLSATDLQQGLSLTNNSADRLYVNFAYQGVSKTKPQATTGDLTIERDYYDSKGQQIDASKLKVGDMVLVAIRVYSERRSPDLLVVDLLPAGLELENQNLSHAIKLDSIIFDGKPASEWQKKTNILHQEFRDDRYVAAIDVGYRGTSYLFYLARAVTPGKYLVPAPLVENMYQPDKNAVGDTLDTIEITNL